MSIFIQCMYCKRDTLVGDVFFATVCLQIEMARRPFLLRRLVSCGLFEHETFHFPAFIFYHYPKISFHIFLHVGYHLFLGTWGYYQLITKRMIVSEGCSTRVS